MFVRLQKHAPLKNKLRCNPMTLLCLCGVACLGTKQLGVRSWRRHKYFRGARQAVFSPRRLFNSLKGAGRLMLMLRNEPWVFGQIWPMASSTVTRLSLNRTLLSCGRSWCPRMENAICGSKERRALCQGASGWVQPLPGVVFYR